MNALLQTIIAQAFVGSLAFWYYGARIGWLGMTYMDRVSMRWLDVAVLGGLAAAGFLFLRQARLTGAQFLVRVFRIAMLLSAALAACLAIAVLLTFALVPYVPASYPPATPGTWISLPLNYAAPVVASLATASLLVSSFYFLSTRSRAA